MVHVSARVPTGAGDSSGSVVFAPGVASTGDAGAVSVPVTLRGQVPAKPGVTGAFDGVLTGGNGRSPGEGQVAAYTFDVPANQRDLDADVILANDPANQIR